MKQLIYNLIGIIIGFASGFLITFWVASPIDKTPVDLAFTRGLAVFFGCVLAIAGWGITDQWYESKRWNDRRK